MPRPGVCGGACPRAGVSTPPSPPGGGLGHLRGAPRTAPSRAPWVSLPPGADSAPGAPVQPAGLCRGGRGESPRAPASCPCSAARGLPVPRSGRQWVQAGPRGSALPLRVGPLCYCREASRPAGQELSCQQRPAWAQGRRPLGASSLPGGGGGARPHFQCGSSCRHLPLSACHCGQGAGPARHPVTRLDRRMPSAECSPPTRPCRVNVCLPWGSEGHADPLRVFCGASSGLAPSAPLASTRSVPGASVPGPSVPGPSVAGPVSSWTHLASVEHASAPVPQRTRGGVPSSPAPAAPLLALLCASHSLPAAAVGRLRDLAVTLACPAPPAQLTAQLLGSAPPPPPPSAMCPRQPVECARPRAGPQSSRPPELPALQARSSLSPATGQARQPAPLPPHSPPAGQAQGRPSR